MAFRQFEYVFTNSELLCLNLMFVYYVNYLFLVNVFSAVICLLCKAWKDGFKYIYRRFS